MAMCRHGRLGGMGLAVLVLTAAAPAARAQLVLSIPTTLTAHPGDTITITATQVIVNGVTLNEQYVANVIGSSNPVIVPKTKLDADSYWIMNDSRLAKDDSRSFGAIARQNIVGKAVLVFWPASSFGGVSNFSDVFKDVH